jgi:hypothetical protein
MLLFVMLATRTLGSDGKRDLSEGASDEREARGAVERRHGTELPNNSPTKAFSDLKKHGRPIDLRSGLRQSPQGKKAAR